MNNNHKKGFASIPKDRGKAIASLGGTEAQRLNRAHRWTSEEAKQAGIKGRLAYKAKLVSLKYAKREESR